MASRMRVNSSMALGRNYNLAELLLVLQAAVRLGDLGERIHAIDHRLELFPEDELQHLVQLAHGAHEAAQEAPLLAEQEAQVEPCVEAGGRAARHETAGGGERLETLRPRGDTHVLDHHVDTALAGELLDLGGNILLVVVNYVIGAELARLGEVGLSAGGGNHQIGRAACWASV